MRLISGNKYKLITGKIVTIIKFVDNDYDCGWKVTDGTQEWVAQRMDFDREITSVEAFAHDIDKHILDKHLGKEKLKESRL